MTLTNLTAMSAARNARESHAALERSLARLSSGSKIVEPIDDVAGSAVSLRLGSQVNRISATRANIANAMSFTQTQEGYLGKVAKAFSRMSELAILAQDGTKNDGDRLLYQAEYQTLAAHIQEASTKQFNGVPLFSSATLEVLTDEDGNTFPMAGVDLGAPEVTQALGGSLSTIGSAASALADIRNAIASVSMSRGLVGSHQARLIHTAEQLGVNQDKLDAAKSVIQDLEVAEESAAHASAQVLSQSGAAMLAQANKLPDSVLRLLQI